MSAWFEANASDVTRYLRRSPRVLDRAIELASESEKNAESFVRAAFEAEMGPSAKPKPVLSEMSEAATSHEVKVLKRLYDRWPSKQNRERLVMAMMRGRIHHPDL